MAGRGSGYRAVNGIVLLDKSSGMTSNRALQRVKRLYRAAKAGHTGSLDPFATGMLPICLGSATKVSAYLLESAKEYRVRFRFGTATDTADVDGQIIEQSDVPELSRAAIESALAEFIGSSTQIPPMYSAVKHQGRRLYELARAGVHVDRAPRRIRIDWIRLDACEWPDIECELRCSKGTYIRSLAVDIAARLGTVAHVVMLRRLAVDPFGRNALVTEHDLSEAAGLGDDALDRYLLRADVALPQFPSLRVDAFARADLVHGRAPGVASAAADAGFVRVYGPDDEFVGLAEIRDDGRAYPRRIFSVDMVE